MSLPYESTPFTPYAAASMSEPADPVEPDAVCDIWVRLNIGGQYTVLRCEFTGPHGQHAATVRWSD